MHKIAPVVFSAKTAKILSIYDLLQGSELTYWKFLASYGIWIKQTVLHFRHQPFVTNHF